MRAPDAVIGREVHCPQCGGKIAVAAGAASNAALPRVQPRKKVAVAKGQPPQATEPYDDLGLEALPHATRPPNPARIAGVVMGAVALMFLAFAIIYAMLQVGSEDSDKPEPDNGVAEFQPPRPGPESGQERLPAHLPKQSPKKPPELPPSKLMLPFDALGPKLKLEKIKAVQIKGKAHFAKALNINDVTITWQSTVRFKFLEVLTDRQSLLLLDGDRGWSNRGVRIAKLDHEELASGQNLLYSLSISNLTPLKESRFKVSKAEDAQIRNRECFSFKVTSHGRPPMLLFFDKETRLLAKTEFRFKPFAYDTNKVVDKDVLLESYYSNYKKVADVNHWNKYEQYRDGAKYAELNISDVRFFEHLDEKLFDPLPSILADENRRFAEEQRRLAEARAERRRRLAEQARQEAERKRRLAEQAELAAKAKALAEQEAASRMEKANKLEGQRRLEEALDLCERVLKDYPETKAAGDAWRMQSKIGPVVAGKRAAAKLESAQQLKAQGKLLLADNLCTELLGTYPGTKAAGEARALQKKIKPIIAAAEKEERAAVRMKLIKSLLQERKTEGAVRILKKLVKEFPGTPTAKEAKKLIKQYDD
jgi:hypothetical protein